MPLSRNCSRKKEATVIDKESFFRNFIDSLFITASWVDEVKKATGITAVSQVWSDIPRWYVWIEGTPGPFELALPDTGTVTTGNRSWALGHFTLKCFPSASHPMFATLSEEERQCLVSDCFDQTGTPAMESMAQIPETYFVVGSLSVTTDIRSALCLLTYDSLDLFRSCRRKEDSGAGDTVDLIRQVPGWQTGYPLFDRLGSLYAFFSRQVPFRWGGTRSAGFDILYTGNGEPVCRERPDLSHFSASLMFQGRSTAAPGADTLWQSRLEAGEEPLFETCCDSGPRVVSGISCCAEHFPVNRLWWDLATLTARSHLSSTCGCGQDCHHRH